MTNLNESKMILILCLILNLLNSIIASNTTTTTTTAFIQESTNFMSTTRYDSCLKCKNQAYCKRDSLDDDDQITCYCVPGYTGKYCDRDINECLSQPCLNNATCLNLINEYKCVCDELYTGLNCDIRIVTACDSRPCLNDATCLSLPNGDYSCECSSGYTGKNCSNEINECESEPCNINNTLKCIDLLNSYKCECKFGFEGVNCDKKVLNCASNQDFCMNNSTCNDFIDHFECSCQTGFKGTRCEEIINECVEHEPCLNNATCDPFFADYRCTCTPGFEGRNCEININECDTLPCSSNGHCIDLVNDYKCLCNSGFTGKNCEIDVDECALKNPCENGATCINLNSNTNPKRFGYMCDCTSIVDSTSTSQNKYVGQNCSIRLDLCEKESIYTQCKNDATCETTFNYDLFKQEFKCNCKDGFIGKFCDQQTVIQFDSSYSLEHSLIQSEEHEPFQLKFEFKTSQVKEKLPLLVLYLDKFNLELVLTKYSIEINKYYKDLGFNHTLMPFLNSGQWHSLEVNVRVNIISIKYSNGHLSYDYSFTYKEQPPKTFYNFYRAIIITIGKYYIIPVRGVLDEFDNFMHTQREPYFNGCTKNIRINNDEYLFLNNQSIKYGCPKETNMTQVSSNGQKFIFNQDESSLALTLIRPVSHVNTSFLFNYDYYNEIQLFQLENDDVQLTMGVKNQKLFIEKSNKNSNDSILSIENLNNEPIVPNNEHKIQISIDFTKKYLLLKLNSTTKIRINSIEMPLNSNKIKFASQYYGYLSEISLNDETVDPFKQQSAELFIISQAKCLNESCNQLCSQFASKQKFSLQQGQSFPNSNQNLLYNFKLLRNDTLRTISFDVNMRLLHENNRIFNLNQSNRTLIELLFKKFNFNNYFIYNNNVSIIIRNETSNDVKRVKLIFNMIDGKLGVKINGLLVASGLGLLENLTSDELSLAFIDSCVANLQINGNLIKEDSNNQFEDFNLVNHDCVKPKKSEVTQIAVNPYECDKSHACAHNATQCVNQLNYRFSKKLEKYQKDYSFKCVCFEDDCKQQALKSYNQTICASGVYCLNGGFCDDQITSQLKCACDKEYRGDRCEIYDPCSSSAQICSSQSNCIIYSNNTFMCECHYGYVGKYCQYKVDETCYNSNLCQNNGLCVDQMRSNGEKAFKCECADGYFGERCENKVDRCESDRPCKNGAICFTRHDLDRGYECVCSSEWMGTNCDVDFDECSSNKTNKCSKNSLCINKSPSYSCRCKNKYTYGKYCQFESICRYNPCGYHGKCVPSFNPNDEDDHNHDVYSCKCNHGYSGVNCSFETCDLNLCLHGSHCHDDNKQMQFRCDCDGTGYDGRLCEIRLDTSTTSTTITITASNTRPSTTTLKQEQESTTSGVFDEQKLFKIEMDPPTQPSLNMKSTPPKEYMYHLVLWPLMGLMVGLLIILGMIFIMKTKKSRATRGTYSPSRHEQHCSRIEFTMDLKRPPEERLI